MPSWEREVGVATVSSRRFYMLYMHPARKPYCLEAVLLSPSLICRHGRDNKLIVWKLTAEDERSMSTRLPLNESGEKRPMPWMLHLLEVNTMNFCTFSLCPLVKAEASPRGSPELLIAVPNTLLSEAVSYAPSRPSWLGHL